jgi:hypothetical protein
MKHLRRFNESLDEYNSESIKDFCETNLAYLIDEGFELEITEMPLSKRVGYKIKIVGYDRFSPSLTGYDQKYYHWDELKDHVIPFLKRLSDKYYIMNRYHLNRSFEHAVTFWVKSLKDYPANFNGVGSKDVIYTLDEVLEDKSYSLLSDKQMLIGDICIKIGEKR